MTTKALIDRAESAYGEYDETGRGLINVAAFVPDLIAALRAAEAERDEARRDEWQPAETAPQDGTCFTVWISGHGDGYHLSPCRYTNGTLEHYNARVFDWFPVRNAAVTSWAPIVQLLPPPARATLKAYRAQVAG